MTTSVALYARVSTSDRDQNPESQLVALREYSSGQEWEISVEYVDQAPAGDHAKRTAWTELLDAGARGRFNLLLVFRLDRAFRSVLDAATTLERLRSRKVGSTELSTGLTFPGGKVTSSPRGRGLR